MLQAWWCYNCSLRRLEVNTAPTPNWPEATRGSLYSHAMKSAQTSWRKWMLYSKNNDKAPKGTHSFFLTWPPRTWNYSPLTTLTWPKLFIPTPPLCTPSYLFGELCFDFERTIFQASFYYISFYSSVNWVYCVGYTQCHESHCNQRNWEFVSNEMRRSTDSWTRTERGKLLNLNN